MIDLYAENTLRYLPEKCNGCGMCSIVCPHGVFIQEDRKAVLVRPKNCMECGACQKNCPAGAISVENGVGCAAAWMMASLKKSKKPTCGCSETPSCC